MVAYHVQEESTWKRKRERLGAQPEDGGGERGEELEHVSVGSQKHSSALRGPGAPKNLQKEAER